jgi:hypothetical protein
MSNYLSLSEQWLGCLSADGPIAIDRNDCAIQVGRFKAGGSACLMLDIDARAARKTLCVSGHHRHTTFTVV